MRKHILVVFDYCLKKRGGKFPTRLYMELNGMPVTWYSYHFFRLLSRDLFELGLLDESEGSRPRVINELGLNAREAARKNDRANVFMNNI